MGSLRVGSGHKGPSPRGSLRMEPCGWPADPEQSCKGQAGPDLSWKRRKPSEAEARAERDGHGNQQGQNQQEPSVFQESLPTRSPPFAFGQRREHRQFITALGRQARTGAWDQFSLTKLATSQRRWQTRSSDTTCAITARRICESWPGCSRPARIRRQSGPPPVAQTAPASKWASVSQQPVPGRPGVRRGPRGRPCQSNVDGGL